MHSDFGALKPRVDRAANFVETPAFKLLQVGLSVLLTTVVSIAGWSMTKVVDQLDSLEVSINRSETREAVNELRRLGLERDRDRHATDIRVLQDRNAEQDYELRRLGERVGSTSFGGKQR